MAFSFTMICFNGQPYVSSGDIMFDLPLFVDQDFTGEGTQDITHVYQSLDQSPWADSKIMFSTQSENFLVPHWNT